MYFLLAIVYPTILKKYYNACPKHLYSMSKGKKKQNKIWMITETKQSKQKLEELSISKSTIALIVLIETNSFE